MSAIDHTTPTASRVLIVDGSRGTRRMLGLKLEKLGYTVAAAGSSSQALAKLHSATFDVICTTLALPDDSGIKLIEATRKLPGQGHTPIILVSGQEVSLEDLDPGDTLEITEIVDKAKGIGYIVGKISEYCEFTLTQPGQLATFNG